MKVLAVVPDGNVLDRVAWLAKWNPDIEWDVIGISSDCAWEPVDWASSFECIDCDWREVKNTPQEPDDDVGLGGNSCFVYEDACQSLRSPLLGYWFHYDKWEMLRGLADLDNAIRPRDDYDVLVTWGERGWYNECATRLAAKAGVPHCRLERATFPGMFVADGTGLEQGRCDLEKRHGGTLHNALVSEFFRTITKNKNSDFNHWLSVAPWQNIESQPRTTLGMASEVLDDRPSVFVPLQVPVDTNMVFRGGDVTDNYGLLEYVLNNYTDHNIIVKKHPGDGFTPDSALEDYCNKHRMHLVTGSTHAYLQLVDKVVSINSQVIIEAWMHSTEVEVLGKPAFDLPDEEDKQSLLYTLRFAYYVEPWQLTERLSRIRSNSCT